MLEASYGRYSITIACIWALPTVYWMRLSQLLDPSENNELAFVQLVWPTSLCELIAVETNRYAQQNNCPKWVDVSTADFWIFLGIVILMGIHTKLRTTGVCLVYRQCNS